MANADKNLEIFLRFQNFRPHFIPLCPNLDSFEFIFELFHSLNLNCIVSDEAANLEISKINV